MEQKQFIEGSIEALRKNTIFRNAQNRRYFYGESVMCSKYGFPTKGVIDGFGTHSNKHNVYHVKNMGWFTASNIEPVFQPERINKSNQKIKEIVDFNDKNTKGRIISIECLTDIDVNRLPFDVNHLPLGRYPIVHYNEELNNGDSVQICAPGLFCDGMEGKVITEWSEIITKVSEQPNEFEVVVEFPLPEDYYNISPQSFIVPKMYVKKISSQNKDDILEEGTNNFQSYNEKSAESKDTSVTQLSACNYTFTDHMYKKMLTRLAKELDNGLYSLNIAFIIAILKYKATECNNGNMSIYIGDDKEGQLFFENLYIVEENLNIPMVKYFEFAKLGPIE